MSEERTQQRQQQDSPLQTERGGTRIEDSVVSKIAGIAAQEVDGVRMGGGTSQAIGGLLSLGQERLSLLLGDDTLGDVVMGHNGEDRPAMLQARRPKLKPTLLDR